jgi:putative membrane fusion protein
MMANADGNMKRRRVKRRSSRKGLSPRLKQAAVLLMIILAGWLSWEPVRERIVHLLIDYHEVETGTVEKDLPVNKALVIRDETVLFAPQPGTLKRVVPEGQRVAEGETVALIQSAYGGSQPIRAVRAGVVSYYTDGMEHVLTPETVETLNLADVEIASHVLGEAAEGKMVEKGQAVAKIVDNLQPYLVWTEFDVEHLASFPPVGRTVNLQLDEIYCQGKLLKVTARGVVAEALLELSREELLLARELSLKLVLESKKGLIIPNEALLSIDDKPGVYKKTTTGSRWVSVTIEFQNEEYSVVKGLARGDRIVTNPRLLHPDENR